MAYEPTHDVPSSGLPAFAEPDATPGPAAQLVPGLDVQVLERRDDWAYIECSNGWKAWVNGTLLVARAAVPPPPAPEPTPPPPPPAPESAPAPPPPVAAPAPPPPMSTPAASEPSGAWAAPSAPAVAGTSGRLGLGPGHIVALVGAAVVALSTLLNWIDFEGSTASAHNVPAAFLLNTDNAGDGGLGVGWLLILFMVVAAVGVFVEKVRWLTIVGGGAAVLVVVLFVFQLNSFVDQVNDQAREFGVDTVGLFDVMTYWPFLTLVGAAAAIVGGVLVLTRPRIAA